MIVNNYICDLCKREVRYPFGGFHLSFSGCGGISFVFLDNTEKRKNDSIVCKSCAHGLRYATTHIPKHPDDDEDED